MDYTTRLYNCAFSNVCTRKQHDIHANPNTIVNIYTLNIEAVTIGQQITFIFVILSLDYQIGSRRNMIPYNDLTCP